MFGRRREHITVHVLIRGRIGEGWYDIDEHVRVVPGTTLAQLVARSTARLPLAAALAASPHLADTLMLNGERVPIATQGERALADRDELYLLAPIAGGR